MKPAVLTEKVSASLIIIFNRPEIRSPLSIFVLKELNKILDDSVNNQLIEKIIFTGKADVFASGADLREIAETAKDTAREFALRGQNLMNKIAASDKRTIAAINKITLITIKKRWAKAPTYDFY